MTKSILPVAVFLLLFPLTVKAQVFKSVAVDTVFSETISIRALSFLNDTLYFAGNKSRVGFISLDAERNNAMVVTDSTLYEYRSVATNGKHVFALSIGNPAKLYRFSSDLKQKVLVYEEKHEKVFYDSMQFWNAEEGIAIGDPTDKCLSMIITRDGGATWQKISCDVSPEITAGEAAFAASNTNVVLKGNHVWVVSGGKKSRVFHSENKGKSWKVFDTPIVQGEAMTGIFTADFYDEQIGFIAGGNYEKPIQNFQNKAMTTDGGKTWNLVADNQAFGYASCVQFVPNSAGKALVTVGTQGVFYSADAGQTWQQLLSDQTLYTIRFLDSDTAYAAGKNKIIKIEFKK
ncbi:oxidoreductase [Flavobacterium sp.]|uniref:WD40/YVTN/BNR-like repeat-containing protein n=1 Tax=Flavobacterium sp. TaxID=239 RepID=UPI0025F1A154|nr:oxidoreductase [Flavobacterium sp.]